MIVTNIIILLNFQTGADYLPTWPHKWWDTQILAWPPTSEYLSGLAISDFLLRPLLPPGVSAAPLPSKHRLDLLCPHSFVHHHAKHEPFTPIHGTD